MKRVLLLVFSLFLVGCSSDNELPERSISSQTMDKAIANTVDYFSGDDTVRDIYIELSDRSIVMVVQLRPTATRELGLEYLDNMARLLNANVSYIEDDINSATKNYLGGLYDIYEVNGSAITSSEHILVNITKSTRMDFYRDFD